MMFLSTWSNFSGSIETEVGRRQEWFTRSSNDRIAWAMQGAELFGDYMAGDRKRNNS